MNQKDLLNLVQENPSVETAQLACDWIKSKKPSSKAAHRVLGEVVKTEYFEAELPRITPWIEQAPWDALMKLAQKTESPSVFYWIIDVLEGNPRHLQAGELWYRVVSNCRNFTVATKASEWFINNCSAEHNTVMLTRLLTDDLGPQPVIIKKARSLFGKSANDLALLETLLEFDDFPPAIEMASNLIRNSTGPYQDLEIKALLRRNPKRFLPIIEEHVRKWRNHKHVYLLLMSCAEQAPEEFLPIISDWINSRKNSDQASFFMSHLAIFPHSKSIADLVWTWWQKRLPSKEAVFSIQVLLSHRDPSILPEGAIDWGLKWILENQENQSWTQLAASLVRISKDSGRLRIGVAPLDRLNEHVSGELMASIANYSSDAASIEIARQWRAKFPTDKYSVVILEALCRRFPDREVLDLAISSIPTFAKPIDRHLLAALVKTGNKKSISDVKEWLTARQIHKRWSSQHYHRGMFMRALLEWGDRDPVILDLVRDWLRLRPSANEQELQAQLQRAVETAGR